MNNFDIVRLELATDIHSDPDEAIAALDRIEAWATSVQEHGQQVMDDLNTENARLREALERIQGGSDYAPWSMDEGWKHRLTRKEMQTIARAALSKEES